MAVDAVEIGEMFERAFQRRRVVVAGAARARGLPERHGPEAGREESALSLHERASRLKAIEPDSQPIWPVLCTLGNRVIRNEAGKPGLSADVRPEFAQLRHAMLGCVAGDDRSIQRTDRDARDPVRLDARLGKPLVDACLIRAKRAAAL